MGLRYAGDVAIRQPSAQATVPDPFIELLAYARANDFDLPTDTGRVSTVQSNGAKIFVLVS